MTETPMPHPQEAPTPSPSPLICDGTLENFRDVVLEASMAVPVLVDFWADWCSPCKQLMPLLEKVVTEKAGAVKLVKVNADQNQAITGQLRIQSLPTVMAFFQGQPIDGFQGALPESQLRQFIDGVMEKTGAAAPDSMEAQIAAALEQVEAMLDAGEAAAALQVLGQILSVDSENAKAKLLTCEAMLATGGADQVPALLDSIPEEALKGDKELAQRAATLRTRLELLKATEGLEDKVKLLERLDADARDHQARYDLAMVYLAEGNQGAAAEELLRILMVEMDWEDQKARKQLLKLFDAAGPTDPFTLKYRRRLSSLLFS